MNPPDNTIVKTFLIATDRRDPKYTNPSNFVYDLPNPLFNVIGVSIRDYKFVGEGLINENNKTILGTSNVLQPPTQFVLTTVGDFSRTIGTLNTHLNTRFTGLGVTFGVDSTTNNANITINAGSPSSYAIIYPGTPLLRILGFSQWKDSGVGIYKTATVPPSVPFNVTWYEGVAVAPQPHDMYNNTDLVLRIENVETLLSNDPVTNRSTAVLFSNLNLNAIGRQTLNHYTPLLQQQHRLQSLRIQILNTEGDLYDLRNNPMMLVMQFFCLPQGNV